MGRRCGSDDGTFNGTMSVLLLREASLKHTVGAASAEAASACSSLLSEPAELSHSSMRLLVAVLLLLLPHEARGLRVGTSPSSSRRCCDARAAECEQPVRLWNSGVCPFAQVANHSHAMHVPVLCTRTRHTHASHLPSASGSRCSSWRRPSRTRSSISPTSRASSSASASSPAAAKASRRCRCSRWARTSSPRALTSSGCWAKQHCQRALARSSPCGHPPAARST